MVYTPIQVVTVNNNRLEESTDLTVAADSFFGKQAYLVLTQGNQTVTLDINAPFLFERGLLPSDSIGMVFSRVLSDLFVARYKNDKIPLRNLDGYYENKLRVFNPVSYKDYKVQFTSMDTPEIVDDILKKGYLDDLVITSEEAINNCLVAVNGVFHRTTLFNNKLYVHDGFRTMRLANRKDVTLVDTSRIRGHSTIPLTTVNTSLSQYNGEATVKLNTPLQGKTVFLVIDGYFYHIDTNVFYFSDSNSLKIYTNKLPLISQFRHNPRTILFQDRFGQDAPQSSRKYSDNYDALFLNNRQVPMATFATKEFQLSRLTHYHSFLVVVDNPALFYKTNDVIPTGTPQYYQEPSTRIVSGMISYGAGLCPSYLIKKDPFKRKSIFIPEQDYDIDYDALTHNPAFIPAPIKTPETGIMTKVQFTDYISA